RLTQISTSALGSFPATTQSYTSFDALGRVLASNQLISGSNGRYYPFSYIYNDQNLDTMIYPSLRKVQSCYDAAGRISTLKNTNYTTPRSYASNIQYKPYGVVSSMTLGNGQVETRGYDDQRMQPTSVSVSQGGNNLLSLGFSYCTSGSSCTNN